MLAQFIYDTENWFYEKKIQNFFIFFTFFSSFLDTLHTQKDFFCTFGPKISYFYILGGQHVHLTAPKCFSEAYSTSCTSFNFYWWSYSYFWICEMAQVRNQTAIWINKCLNKFFCDNEKKCKELQDDKLLKLENIMILMWTSLVFWPEQCPIQVNRGDPL